MIIGDPYKFAVLFDRVANWNNSIKYNNGFFALCINGKLFPDIVINAIISVDVVDIKKSLMGIPINEKIYDMDKENAFKALYELVYPDFDNDYDNDYRYLLSPHELTDDDYLVFAVEGRGKIKILAARLEYDREKSRHIFDDEAVQEMILNKNEVEKIIEELDKL